VSSAAHHDREPKQGGKQPPDNRQPAATAKTPPRSAWRWFLLILAFNYLLASFLFPSDSAPVSVPYTLFKEEVGKNNVEAIYNRGEIISGRFVKAASYTPNSKKGARAEQDRPSASKQDAAGFSTTSLALHDWLLCASVASSVLSFRTNVQHHAAPSHLPARFVLDQSLILLPVILGLERRGVGKTGLDHRPF
jgi:hypothetical protein